VTQVRVLILGGKGSGRRKAIRVNVDPATLTDKEILTIALGKPLAEKLTPSIDEKGSDENEF
jgi:hypothetical protein